MGKRFTNLEQRDGGIFYYRGSFSLGGKAHDIRVSLNTRDLLLARERAGRIDRRLKKQWRRLMAQESGLTDEVKTSIMRASARRTRDNLEIQSAEEEARDPDTAREEMILSARARELIVHDMLARGAGTNFGSYEHFRERFVEADPDTDSATLELIEDIFDHSQGLLAIGWDGAEHALRQRNVTITSANIVLAQKAKLTGILLALQQYQADLRSPEEALDRVMAELDFGKVTKVEVIDPANHVAAESPAIIEVDRFASMDVCAAAKAFLNANPRYDVDLEGSAWTPKTKAQFEATMFLAGKFFQSAAVATLDDDKVADFLRALSCLPMSHHKTQRHFGMSLADITAESNDGGGLSIVTVNRHMRFLKMLMDWLARKSDAIPDINWAAFIRKKTGTRRGERAAFEASELEALFAGAVWQGSKSKVRRLDAGQHIWHGSAYWLPILLVFTGCRREEIAKLALLDVETIDGISVLRIRVTEAGRLKNESSVRDIPVADELKRLGFLDFVEVLRSRGETLLFPDLAGGKGVMGDAFYKKWWRAFERAGLIPAGRDMHAIRHFVSTALSRRKVTEEERADLLGHTMASETAGRYTKRTELVRLQEIVNLIPPVTANVPARPINLG